MARQRHSLGIAAIYQQPSLFAHLSVEEMKRLLEMPDGSGPLGRRDRAILSCSMPLVSA